MYITIKDIITCITITLHFLPEKILRKKPLKRKFISMVGHKTHLPTCNLPLNLVITNRLDNEWASDSNRLPVRSARRSAIGARRASPWGMQRCRASSCQWKKPPGRQGVNRERTVDKGEVHFGWLISVFVACRDLLILRGVCRDVNLEIGNTLGVKEQGGWAFVSD